MSVENNKAQIYLTFIVNALRSATPQVDAYFESNKDMIKEMALLLHETNPVEAKTIYRGLLLDNQNTKTLEPLAHIKFLSFSEEKQIAKNFADINHTLGIFMKKQYPNAKGYMIEHTPSKDEILFHHSWVECLGLDCYFDRGSLELIQEQKEVTLFQNMKRFNLKEVC